MVVEPEALAYLTGDGRSLEADGLDALERDGEFMFYRHGGLIAWPAFDAQAGLPPR